MSDAALPIALQALGLGASSRADIATILAALVPEWADGVDLAYDIKAGVQYGAPAYLSDVHANPVLMLDADGLAVTKGANVACQETGIGSQVVPSVTQILDDPTALSTEYATKSGTGTITQNATDPSGVANLAWTLEDTSTSATYLRQRNLTVSNDSVSRVLSVMVGKTTGVRSYYPSVITSYSGGTGKSSEAAINTSTGALSITNPANAVWWVEDWGNYWLLSSSIANNSTGNTTLSHSLYPARQATFGTNSVTAIGATVFAWPNIYVGDINVPPILDNIAAGGNIASLPILSEPVSGFVVLDIQDRGTGSIRAFTLDDGTGDNYLALQYVSGRAVLRLVAATAEQSAVDIGPWRVGRQTIAFAAGADYVWGQFVRGPAVAADTSATFPTLTKMGFGGLTGSTTDRRARVVVERVGLVYGTANALSAQRAYAKAVSAAGAKPLAWDNFDRANGVAGSLPTLQPWVSVPGNGGVRVVAAISSGALVATDSGQSTTAAYTVVDLGKNAERIRARIAFGSGTTGGGAGLIVTASPPPTTSVVTYITVDGSIHIIFTDASVIVGFYQNSVNTTIATLTYPEACLLDGTEYEFGYDLSGESATFYIPNSAPITLTDSRFSTLNGHYVTYEHFWATGQCQPKFLGIEAD